MGNYQLLFDNFTHKLIENNIEPSEAKLEVSLLFEKILGVSKKELIMQKSLKLSEDKLEEINNLVKKRIEEKMPVQYLVNSAYFMGEEFYVDKNVLIPRPETEILVKEVLKMAQNKSKIIDIGTGSGCIAIMLVKNLPDSQIAASDISDKALEIAGINADRLGVSDKIRFISSDIFKNIDESEKFDIIVSNPPYISIKEKDSLQIEVSRHEPMAALFVEDETGTCFYKKLAQQSVSRLNSGGYLAVEVGFSQAQAVIKIFKTFNLTEIRAIKDLSGIERVIIGKMPQ